MKFRSIAAFTCLLLAGFTSSCREDPEDVKQHEQLSAELSRLRSGISIIEGQISDMPADLSFELKEAVKHHEFQKAEIERLKLVISDISTRAMSVRDEMKAYRIKYQIK